MKMNKKILNTIIASLISIVLFISCHSPAYSQYPQQYQQQYPQTNEAQIDQMLKWQDQQIMSQFQSKFVSDGRYNAFIHSIMQRMNTYLTQVYGQQSNLYISGFCFASSLGFNAVTGYRIIIFDSLLLDTLKFLADGIAVYGGVDNQYVQNLARTVVNLCAQHQQGNIRPNTSNLYNPFNLPTLTNLTQEQRMQSQKLFTDMVASWVAHEGSHGFLEHIKEKMKISLTQQAYSQGKYPPQAIQQQINQYLTYSLGPKMELEADTKGTILLLKSGYSVDGFIWWLKFADILEQLMGTKNSYMRTHPSSEQRIQNILQTKQQVLQYSPAY